MDSVPFFMDYFDGETRPAGVVFDIAIRKLINRRVPARQPCSFSLLEPQRKRTKRNDSLAAGISVAAVRCFDDIADELIAEYRCRTG